MEDEYGRTVTPPQLAREMVLMALRDLRQDVLEQVDKTAPRANDMQKKALRKALNYQVTRVLNCFDRKKKGR